MCNQATPAKRLGRPAGTTKASGAKVSSGRPPSLDKSQQKRYRHWLTWWPTQDKVSAYALAKRMKEAESTVRAYAAGTRTPGPVALANLESLSAAYGYQPLVLDPIL